MITFIICLACLITAYFTYGKYLEKVAGADNSRTTPVSRLADGVDYIPMPRWKVFLIQLLNIAGTGPIFGAILGACFGPVAFLWITLGGIFFGAMHDYFSGMMELRHDGKSLPEVAGIYLGNGMKNVMRYFSVLLMVLVGAVFLLSPAQLLGSMVPAISTNLWVWIILIYYIIATMLPIDKVIGKCYPIFGAALIFMAVGLLVAIFADGLPVPELTTLHNFQLNPEALPIIPTLFITIAAMISESVIALIWAAIAMAFFGDPTQLNEALAANDNNAAWAVNEISVGTMGKVGAVLALLGVVVAPITSGDTAFRSARLIIADMTGIDQRPIRKRFLICLPLFVVGYCITLVDFGIVWRYFAWANQTLAAAVLWSIYVWLFLRGKNVWIALIPAIVVTYVVSSFIFISPQFLGMENRLTAYILGGVTTAAITAFAVICARSRKAGGMTE